MSLKPSSSKNDFFNGLVFGFDVGTASIGWAVRKGPKFLDVGVLICPEDTNDLSKRRDLRRQRRTLRSRKYRRAWFAAELEKLDLPKPTANQFHDPVTLRLRALAGEAITSTELHAALTHLFRRRGYTPVPWANVEAAGKDADPDKEEGQIKTAVAEIREKMTAQGCEHPCQFLAKSRADAGKSPTMNWGRKIYWPRDLLEKEFRAIAAAQSKHFPSLAEKLDWLLYGDTQEVKGHHVFFKNSEARNPGVLGLRWPRFENRGPAVDSLRPVDEEGRPLHVVRKDKPAFAIAQWELAVMNFRVVDRNTGGIVSPDAKAMTRLREMWESSRRNKVKGVTPTANDLPTHVEVKVTLLQKWEKEFSNQYKLIEGQQPLTPQTGAGRSRYSTPTLDYIRKTLAEGGHFDPPQPILRRPGETAERALNRYLADIKHPLVRHRLVLFRRQLAELTARFGEPNMIVLEAVRSLALSQTKKRELMQRNKVNRDERAGIREELKKEKFSSSNTSIKRYRLFKEAKGRCPFCLCPFCLQQVIFKDAEIEHLVPQSRVDCDEFYNLTVACRSCNKLKDNKTPYEAFGNTPEWEGLRQNAETCFGLGSLKYRLFTNPDAENLVEQKADLQHTAYIARVIRHIALVQLGWLGDDGRDPTPEKQNPALRFQVTNGQLTSRLRKAWGLNQILHPLPAGKRWEDLTDAEQMQMQEKNRGDLRHHSLDAMVIACTLPWLAHRTHGATDEQGRHGWWTQDEKQRSKAANPIFPREGQMRDVTKEWVDKVVVKHHSSRSSHQQGYNTSLYAKKGKNTYVVRKPFTNLTVKNLSSIYPNDFAVYCEAAWARYSEESSDINAELKKTDKRLPERFTQKLCFSHFQQWRADSAPPFQWPKTIKIPIRSVRLIAIKDDRAVVPFSPGTNAYVERTGFKEVRIQPAENGKAYVPVFVPYWKNDAPFSAYAFAPHSKPIAVVRKGQVVELVKPLPSGAPAGKYRVLVMGQEQIKILPPHVANKDDSKVAFGLPKSGLQPYWPDFIRALGYELPHPPSSQPPPAGAGEARPASR